MANIILAPGANPDILARNLMYMGAMARRMPPAWDGARISHPVASLQGQYAGRMLPGRGLHLPFSLKELGINRPLPYVYEQSVVQHIRDAMNDFLYHAAKLDYQDERGAISTYDGIISARGGGKAFDVALTKTSLTTAANVWHSLFLAGGFPIAGTYLGTTAPTDEEKTRASTGAWSLGLINPTNPDKKYLLTFGYVSASQINMIILADLLTAAGAFRLTVNTEEAITTPTAITRYTTGAGVLIYLEITTPSSATSHTVTVKYTNQAGTAGQTWVSAATAVAALVGQLHPPDLGPYCGFASGDYGARSLKSTQSSAALAAGVMKSGLYFPLAFVPGLTANIYAERDSTVQIDGLSELVQTAGGVLGCLTALVLPNAGTSGILTAYMRTCDG